MDTKALRQKILDLAIRGKLVPQDADDEPASVLLERIREEKQQMLKDGKLKPKDVKNDTIIFRGEDNSHYEKFQDGTVKCIEDEIPFEVPEGWEWCRLHSLTLKIGAGSTPAGGASVYTNFGVKFIRSQNVYDDGLVLTNIAYISKEINEKKFGSIVKPKDILLNITGGSIGRCSLVPDNFDIANVNQHVVIIRLVDSSLRNFIHKLIISPYIQSQIFSKQVGSGRGGLSVETLSTFLIPVPPQKEQIAIQKKLKDCIYYLLQIASEKESVETLIGITRMKILDLAIRGQLTSQNPEDEPASAILNRIRTEKEELIKQGKIKRDKKESIIFRSDDNSYYLSSKLLPLNMPFVIPESWTWSTLQELCNYGDCINISSENIPADAWILDLEDIEKDSGNIIQRLTNCQRPSTSAKHKFSKNMVLYSRLRPYLNKVILADADGYCTSEILPLKFAKEIYPRYAQIFLMSPFFIEFASRCSYGMKMPRLGTKDGQRAYFALPPYEEQLRIAHFVDSLFNKIQDIENNII